MWVSRMIYWFTVDYNMLEASSELKARLHEASMICFGTAVSAYIISDELGLQPIFGATYLVL